MVHWAQLRWRGGVKHHNYICFRNTVFMYCYSEMEKYGRSTRSACANFCCCFHVFFKGLCLFSFHSWHFCTILSIFCIYFVCLFFMLEVLPVLSCKLFHLFCYLKHWNLLIIFLNKLSCFQSITPQQIIKLQGKCVIIELDIDIWDLKELETQSFPAAFDILPDERRAGGSLGNVLHLTNIKKKGDEECK